jgi:hypothetical protein
MSGNTTIQPKQGSQAAPMSSLSILSCLVPQTDKVWIVQDRLIAVLVAATPYSGRDTLNVSLQGRML